MHNECADDYANDAIFAFEIKLVSKIESTMGGEFNFFFNKRLVFLPTLLSYSSSFLRAPQQNTAQ